MENKKESWNYKTFVRPFKLFGKAMKDATKPMLKAVLVLFYISLVLFVAFAIAEGFRQPKEYGNPWYSFLWVFSQYIGDPGNFSGPGPVTMVGRLVAVVIGILKIMIFAVPAGMIGSYYGDALKADKRKKEVAENAEKIRKCIRRKQLPGTLYEQIPPYKSLISIQEELGLDNKDILDTVKNQDDMAVHNLASTISEKDNPQDRLVVCRYPMESYEIENGKKKFDKDDKGLPAQKSYGCMINRHSRVTIVVAGVGGIGTSNYAYYLAKYGGFNYISHELRSDDIDARMSFAEFDSSILDEEEDIRKKYHDEQEKYKESRRWYKRFCRFWKKDEDNGPDDSLKEKIRFFDFWDDLTNLSKEGGKDHWVMFLTSITKAKGDYQFYTRYRILSSVEPKDENGQPSTTCDSSKFLQFTEEFINNLQSKISTQYPDDQTNYAIDTDHVAYHNLGRRGISYILHKRAGVNTFRMYIRYDITARGKRVSFIQKIMAQAMQKYFEGGREFIGDPAWERAGSDFEDPFSKVFNLYSYNPDGKIAPMPVKSYGSLIDRGSNVTVVVASSCQKKEKNGATMANEMMMIGVTSFAYNLAEFGGFNFICKQVDANPDKPLNFYEIQDDDFDKAEQENAGDNEQLNQFREFWKDLTQHGSDNGHWVIFVKSTLETSRCQLHFADQVQDSDTFTATHGTLNKCVQEIQAKFKGSEYKDKRNDKLEPWRAELNAEISTSAKEKFLLAKQNDLAVRLYQATGTNVVTLRVYNRMARDTRYDPVVEDMAKIMKANFNPGKSN